MAHASNTIDAYLEVGKKRIWAGALDWPGWCRFGRDERTALQALVDYGPRYADILAPTKFPLQAPIDVSVLRVVEQLEGTTTTDFGAPDVAPSSDTKPIDGAELQRFQTLLEACWQALDSATQSATGKDLRKGPRGGRGDLEGVVRHVMDAEAGYLARLAYKVDKRNAVDLSDELARTRQAVLEALTAAVDGGLPTRGPRGGTIWLPRYFVRRVAWHVLDHVWEIEDRST